jgi:cellulose synthase/poly-beta-1,6-N-acetylglucosamine synthase-like glycosyltransferase
MILFWYGVAATFFWIVTSLYLQINRAKVGFLADVAATPLSPEASVAVIIAVRNEEEQLRQALLSVCQLHYGPYRILVVNDRSTDRTPEILAEFARQYPAVRVLSIETLPPGWLGKNNALYQGYLQATEEWLLFTDADVEFAPDALRKAMQYAARQQLDHLTLMPEIKSRSGLLLGMLATFKIMLELKLRPWALRNPRSRASMGVGAFNLIRRQAYEQAGTHRPIALRPDDDLKLGELVKKAGLKQDVLYGDGEVALEWYPSVREFVKGLMKNTFATSDYNLLIAIGTALATMLAFALPLPLLLGMGAGPEKAMALVMLICLLPLFISRKGSDGKWWYALLVPLAGWLLVYIILKSALLTLRQGGIYWRESFYPLSDLRKNV